MLTHNKLCAYPHADNDGFITFEEFMVSYARPKPILKNLLIMAVNTAIIYFILQAPFLDTMIKVGGSNSSTRGSGGSQAVRQWGLCKRTVLVAIMAVRCVGSSGQQCALVVWAAVRTLLPTFGRRGWQW